VLRAGVGVEGADGLEVRSDRVGEQPAELRFGLAQGLLDPAGARHGGLGIDHDGRPQRVPPVVAQGLTDVDELGHDRRQRLHLEVHEVVGERHRQAGGQVDRTGTGRRPAGALDLVGRDRRQVHRVAHRASPSGSAWGS
jgi:hypothetical protein